METKVGGYTIIEKDDESLKNLKTDVLNLIFKFIDDKTIKILKWDKNADRREIRKFYPYNTFKIEGIITIGDREFCKKDI